MDLILFIVSFFITDFIVLFLLKVFLENSDLIKKIRDGINNKVKGIKLGIITFIVYIAIAFILGMIFRYDGIKMGFVLGIVMGIVSFLTEKGDNKSNDV